MDQAKCLHRRCVRLNIEVQNVLSLVSLGPREFFIIDRGTQWICSTKYLFLWQFFAGWEMWK